MEYLLLSVITLLISTISGDVEISFMKAAPRLNNSMYCDYYFACHAEGETLQWIVNNNNISDYSGQSVGYVFTGSISTCNYTTTLLSLKPMPPGLSIWDSVLIVSCQSSIDFDVSCTNGSISSMTSSPEKGQNTRAESDTTSVNLEHVLNAYLVTTDSSSCTNIFVCGVDNLFIIWQSQGKSLTFTTFDNIGVARQIPQDTTAVEQRAILIGNEPYSLVVVMIVIGSTEINVTCGYSNNTASFSTISCLETTGSETSTVGESSTMASESSNILPLALGLGLGLGIPLAVLLIAVIVISFCFIPRSKKDKPEQPVTNPIPLETRNERTQPEPETRVEVGPETREEAKTGEELHLEKIKVRDDRKEATYLAMDRGTYKPQLKLEDGDEVATLNPKQGVIISSSRDGYYPMKAKNGVCLIISDCPDSPGTKHDEHNLIETWCYLGYHIEVRREVKYRRFKDTLYCIDDLLRDINTKYYESKFEINSFVCCILAREGRNDKSDLLLKIKTTDIESILDNSEILKNTPKLFFVGFSIKYENNFRNEKKSDHTFISYATSGGQSSYRHHEKGSVYVRVVCKTLCEEAKQRNLTELNKSIRKDMRNTLLASRSQERQFYQNPHERDDLPRSFHFFF